MEVKATVFDTDMFGNEYSEEVDIHYSFDEWADFDD